MTKDDERKDQWIKDTQMFQRIAQIKESSYEELASDWDGFNKKQKNFNSDHASTHLTIMKMGKKAGENRKS